MDICTLATVDKRLLALKVGAELERRHGKGSRYAVRDIKAAARRLNFPDSWDCWALSLYASAEDFVDHHRRTGEDCDYASMHASMTQAIASGLEPPGAPFPGLSHVDAEIDAVSPGGAATSDAASWLDGLHDWVGDVHDSDP